MKHSLSIIFPIYNEQNRIEKSFIEIQKFIKHNSLFDLEIIFVNDGSNDNTDYLITNFIKDKKDNLYKYINSKKNMGKGHALKLGVEIAKNDWVLTTDIDLSVPLIQIEEWFNKYNISKNSEKVFIGSRNIDESKVVKKIYRFILGMIFSNLIKFLFKIKIKDTQCGFKLYKREIAKDAFKNLETLGFAHDIELIQTLNSKNIIVKELPVNWTHVPESKLNIFIDPWKMIIDIAKIYKKLK